MLVRHRDARRLAIRASVETLIATVQPETSEWRNPIDE